MKNISFRRGASVVASFALVLFFQPQKTQAGFVLVCDDPDTPEEEFRIVDEGQNDFSPDIAININLLATEFGKSSANGLNPLIPAFADFADVNTEEPTTQHLISYISQKNIS